MNLVRDFSGNVNRRSCFSLCVCTPHAVTVCVFSFGKPVSISNELSYIEDMYLMVTQTLICWSHTTHGDSMRDTSLFLQNWDEKVEK